MHHLAHSLIALAIQSVIAIATGNWWTGAAAGSAYFVGREYAQAEYRNIEHHYGGRRANMPFWGGMQARAWTLKGITDFVLPTLAVIGTALLARRFNHH
jgi:hypothetical protein